MAITQSVVVPFLEPKHPTHFPISSHHPKPSFEHRKPTQMSLQYATRRTVVSILLSTEAILRNQTANAFEFGMTVPDQTLEEAENGIKSHVQSLLQVKDLLESESWKEAQKALRRSSSYLKQDMYTIIQAKPGSERPQLRKLYSTLFNSVTRLDYAARDKDATLVSECYDNVVVALNDILSRI